MDIEYKRIKKMEEMDNYLKNIDKPIIMIIKNGSKTDGFYGKVYKDIFGFIYGNETDNLCSVIANFIQYETKNGRIPLVFLLGDVVINNVLIKNEPEWLVHSTDRKALMSIIKMGKMLSRIELDKQKIKYLDFGRSILNEPKDYYDFIEFGNIEEPWTEVIIASKQLNRFVNENTEYKPGGRIYVKRESLINHRNHIKFLNHHCIKNNLPLSDIDYCIISSDEFNDIKWTPKIFTEKSNKMLMEKISNGSTSNVV